MQNLLNAQNKFNAVVKAVKAVAKADHNKAVFELYKASEKDVKRFTERKTELNKDEIKNFSKALTQLRYRAEILIKADETLKFAHENNVTIDIAARNVYGKTLSALEIMRGKTPAKFEQAEYLNRTVTNAIAGDPIESEFTLTAGQIGLVCGKNGAMQTSTQPYAVIKALTLVKAGVAQYAGRGENWKTTKFTFNPQSDFIKAINAL